MPFHDNWTKSEPDPRSGMTFNEAVALAQLIRETPGWYVLDIEPTSGMNLEDDRWSVRALDSRDWGYTHYWNRSEIIDQWPQFLVSWNKGLAKKNNQRESEARGE